MSAEHNEPVATATPLHYIPCDGHAVLHHVFHNGRFNGVVAVAVIGIYMAPDGTVAMLQTLRGRESPLQAVLGPYGEVLHGGVVFDSLDSYCEWFVSNHQ